VRPLGWRAALFGRQLYLPDVTALRFAVRLLLRFVLRDWLRVAV
jgi:hypothetical protein